MAISSNSYVIMAMIMSLLLIAGMFLDVASIYYVFLPIFMPIMYHFHWDPIWFGILITINLAIGQVTPPVAVNAYVAAKISKATLGEIGKEALPLILAAVIGLFLIIAFPQIALWLPRTACMK